MCQNANFFGKAVVWFERFTPFSQRLYRICSIKKAANYVENNVDVDAAHFLCCLSLSLCPLLYGVLTILFDVSAVLFNFCNQLNGNGFSVR